MKVSNKYYDILNNLGNENLFNVFMDKININKISKVYLKNPDKDCIGFIDSIISLLDIKFEFIQNELLKIPKEGAFITVSNRKLGEIDEILLIKLISTVRPDFKVITNHSLQRIEVLKDYLFPINDLRKHKHNNNVEVFDNIIKHLESGRPLGVFPAGEISKYNLDPKAIIDKHWNASTLKFIKESSVPVVPVCFQGSNNIIFHLISIINPLLKSVNFNSDLINKKNRTIKVRIGNPISVDVQNQFKEVKLFGRYLKTKTYALGSAIKVKDFYTFKLKKASRVEKIIDPVPSDLIEKEVAELGDSHLLFQRNDFKVYCTASNNIPNVLKEIGRLREVTFREVGEGTNRSIDLDEYDLYYNHLFIWDSAEKKIVGAYRLGKGKDILAMYGKNGFYINSLFKIKKQFLPILNESIELGRSFIVKDYQKKPLSLFLLWKGILYFLITNPEYRFLIGPVSISGEFSKLSKTLIFQFIKSNYYNHQLAKYIKPKNKFRYKLKKIDISIILESTKNNIDKLDHFIEDIEPRNFKIPVLLKKYIQQSAKIIGFNIDPKFNNTLDGLVLMDLFQVPMDTIQSLSKELDDNSILDRFNATNYVYLNSITQL